MAPSVRRQLQLLGPRPQGLLQPRDRQLHVAGVTFDADTLPAQPGRGDGRRAAAEDRIHHKVARPGSGHEEALDQDEKTLNVHVSPLREKIEDDPASPAFVLTVRGVGYAFAER